MKSFLKVLLIAFVCFAIVMTTGTYIFLNSFSKDQENQGKNEQTKDTNRINVLVVGIDAKNVGNSEGARTDTIMLATFDAKTKKVDILSIPRDTRVNIRGRSQKDKINHAHAYGGIELAKKTVKDFLGVEIDYYVKINYDGLGKIVEDIGGVEVDVPLDMKYYDPYADPPLNINIKKGKQVLNGEKAMEFVRFRKGYVDQDLGRISAQHTFITALMDELLEPQTIIKLPKLVQTFNAYVETDMPLSVMTSYAFKARTIKKDDIHMATVPGGPKMLNGISYYIPDMDGTEEILKSIFDQPAIQNENSEDNRIQVSVEILNGSGVGGLAAEVASRLKDLGVDVVNIDNVQGIKYTQTHIYDRKNKLSDGKEIAKILGVGEVESDINNDAVADITIIVGSDMKK